MPKIILEKTEKAYEIYGTVQRATHETYFLIWEFDQWNWVSIQECRAYEEE